MNITAEVQWAVKAYKLGILTKAEALKRIKQAYATIKA